MSKLIFSSLKSHFIVIWLKLFEQKLGWWCWEMEQKHTVVLCLLFGPPNPQQGRDTGVSAAQGARVPGSAPLPCRPGSPTLCGWGAASFSALGVHPHTPLWGLRTRETSSCAAVPDAQQRECGMFWHLLSLFLIWVWVFWDDTSVFDLFPFSTSKQTLPSFTATASS